jgi:hypothetical protein
MNVDTRAFQRYKDKEGKLTILEIKEGANNGET